MINTDAMKTVHVGNLVETLIDLYRVSKDTPSTVFVYDFDGIIAYKQEDLIYAFEEFKGERELLLDKAYIIGLDLKEFDTKLIRHIIYNRLETELPKGGPFSGLYEYHIKTNHKHHIMTARADFGSISRCYAYIEEVKRKYGGAGPLQLYHSGNACKSHLITNVIDVHPFSKIIYLEDSETKARAVHEKYGDRVDTYFYDYSGEITQKDVDKARLKYTKVVFGEGNI